MNHPAIHWLLDLDLIPEDADGLRLVWQHDWPLWVWVLLTLSAVAFAGWSYSRLNGRVGWRAALAAGRVLLLLTLMVVLSGPMIEQPRETVEPDCALMLLDRSRSLNVADAGRGPDRMTRDEQLRALLDRNQPVFDQMAGSRLVRWMGFHSGVFDLNAPGFGSSDELGPAIGEETGLAAAIEQALQRAAGRPLSGLVIFSDGRTTDPPGAALVRRLQAEALPVMVFPLGPDRPATDLAVGAVDAPQVAYIRDVVSIGVKIERAGATSATSAGTVRLEDVETGVTLDQVELPADPAVESVFLRVKPELAGDVTWRVVVETEQEDLIPDNNEQLVQLELVDRALRVLYVEGYPRWEYRYLKNLLVRERSIECSILLLSADHDFAQEGNHPITRFPNTVDELDGYDVIVIGDVPSRYFTPAQASMMLDYLATRGGGLLWIGGERWTPAAFEGTALTSALPMVGSLDLPRIDRPVNMQPAEAALVLSVLRLDSAGEVGWPAALAEAEYRWSQLQWAQRIEPAHIKPTAEVLAETARPVDGAALPLVLRLRYGAGQSVYVATDEIWRWRHGRGERLPEQFWLQLIRMLGRDSAWRGAGRAAIAIRPRQAMVGQPVRAELRLLDARLTEDRRSSVAAVLETEDGIEIARLEMSQVDEIGGRYEASFLARNAGRLRLRVDDPSAPGLSAETAFEIQAPASEMRHPETDHELLRTLAEATGGQVLNDRTLATLPSLLPNRAIRTVNPLRESIWDSPLTLVVLLALLTSEWIGRKAMCLA